MSTDLAVQRKFYAEEIQITSDIRSPDLLRALATVPRERFLDPGPWTIRGEADFQKAPRQTPGDDPRFVYHNVAIAIDAARTLFTGAPGLLAVLMEALDIKPGSRVAHIGTGLGYYTAVIAEAVGEAGSVVGIEVDADLALHAADNLKPWRWASVTHGDGTLLEGPFDAIFVNAGVTHVLPQWIDQLAPGGRMIVPLTATMAGPLGPTMANIGKGLVTLITKPTDAKAAGGATNFAARLVTFVAIYSAIGLRDEALNAKIGAAMAKMPFPMLKTFRLDPHEPTSSCWLHDERGCWSI
jgi:protein-L-isoaspartate(D-aspartate) O-methyltransferase